jgi:glycosyltransferase involved in cell wall biosynthesis
MKFGIYTSFYNVEKYVDRIFDNIESINYENFEWHITDDFSTDNTKNKIMNRINLSPIKDKILFMEQSKKQEMYWEPNLFFDQKSANLITVNPYDVAIEHSSSFDNRVEIL